MLLGSHLLIGTTQNLISASRNFIQTTPNKIPVSLNQIFKPQKLNQKKQNILPFQPLF
jgi:hypothetical protein